MELADVTIGTNSQMRALLTLNMSLDLLQSIPVFSFRHIHWLMSEALQRLWRIESTLSI